MENNTPKLTDQEVLTYAREQLKEHLPLSVEAGYKCSTDDLYNLLLKVGANQTTLQTACQNLQDAPHPATIRNYLNEQLRVDDLPELENQLNAALAAQAPAWLRKKPQKMALDFHDEPYYGKSEQSAGLWVRGPAQDGTTRFYRVATIYVMDRNMRVTLGIRFVRPEDDHIAVLKFLLRRLRATEVEVDTLFLDKGFAGIQEMRFLHKAGFPAVIACPIRGKKGGTRALCNHTGSYVTNYTFCSGKRSFTARLAVCRTFTTSKRTQRSRRKGVWLIYILIHCDYSPERARHQYRRRFGIESSYRCLGKVLGKTTSANPAYRFVLLALGFFLLNVWRHFCYLYTQVPRQGHRFLACRLFQLSRLIQFVNQALDDIYGHLDEITAPAAPIT
jgi:putative transposase